MPGKIDHRRGQHHAIEPALAGIGHAQQHRAAHRMRQRKERRRAVRQHHLPHEGLDVDFVIGKAPDIAFARIAQAARRMALPAPIEHRDRETAIAQIAHGLEIFFDRLAAPGEDTDRSLAPCRRRPTRKAQFRTIRRLDRTADDVFRNGIGGNRDKGHEREPIGKRHRKSRACAAKTARSGPLNAPLIHPYHLRAGRDQRFGVRYWNRDAQGCTGLKPGPMAGGLTATVAQWRTISMRTYDLTPFYRSTVGFDRLFSLLDQATSDGSPGYPPYNIERTGENAYRITVAVSGFSQ